MSSLIILAVSSFCVALVLTPLCRNLALRWGFVDRPDHNRKLHARPIPRIGGVPLFIAYLVSVALLHFSPFHAGNMIQDHFGIVRNLIPAATIIFFAGLLDDLIGLKAWQKLAMQVVASVVAIWVGVQITGIAGHHLPSVVCYPSHFNLARRLYECD